MDVRMLTVGQIAENCFLFRRDGSDRALIVDPGDEAPRILNAAEELGVTIDGILLTHTHFDHIGAVAPIATATGAPVWCPEIEKPVLADINSFVPWPGFGPFESYDADHAVSGGERLELAGMEIDVIFTPGHSPGHVTYSVPEEAAIFSGDVLFQGSVGRTDLPGGDWATLLESLRTLVDSHPPETTVYPGHMGITTLGAERATNPFLAELARSLEYRLKSLPHGREVQGPARHLRRAPRAAAAACADRAALAPDAGARRLRAHRHAGLRGHRALRPRGRPVHRHRAEADV